MKLEVGKKYVDEDAKVIYEAVFDDGEFMFCYSGLLGEMYKYSHDGKAELHYNLVKEHKEPRTKDVWVWWKTDTGEIGVADYPFPHKDTISFKKVTLTEGEYDVV